MASWFKRSVDQDWVDSVNGFWTVLLLVTFSASSFVLRFIMHPVSCWTPAQFMNSHVTYTTQACFEQNSLYSLRNEDAIPIQTPESLPLYHLWVPFILAVQAFGFKLPKITWRVCKPYLSADLDEIVDLLRKAKIRDNKALVHETALVLRSLLQRNKFLLSVLYLIVKLLYCVNLSLQCIVLTVFMRPWVPVLIDRYMPQDVFPYFTKTALCDLPIRILTNVQKYTVQCTLHITEVYEKMYLFIWLWILLLVVVTSLNFLFWLGYLFLPFLRDSRISVYVASGKKTDDVAKFVNEVLGIDGVFITTMMSFNSSETVTAALVQEMFQDYHKNPPAASGMIQDGGASRSITPEIRVEMVPDSSTVEKA